MRHSTGQQAIESNQLASATDLPKLLVIVLYSISPFIIITKPERWYWYSFYHRMEGNLSWVYMGGSLCTEMVYQIQHTTASLTKIKVLTVTLRLMADDPSSPQKKLAPESETRNLCLSFAHMCKSCTQKNMASPNIISSLGTEESIETASRLWLQTEADGDLWLPIVLSRTGESKC